MLKTKNKGEYDMVERTEKKTKMIFGHYRTKLLYPQDNNMSANRVSAIEQSVRKIEDAFKKRVITVFLNEDNFNKGDFFNLVFKFASENESD